MNIRAHKKVSKEFQSLPNIHEVPHTFNTTAETPKETRKVALVHGFRNVLDDATKPMNASLTVMMVMDDVDWIA
jgi:hypothetical protein